MKSALDIRNYKWRNSGEKCNIDTKNVLVHDASHDRLDFHCETNHEFLSVLSASFIAIPHLETMCFSNYNQMMGPPFSSSKIDNYFLVYNMKSNRRIGK